MNPANPFTDVKETDWFYDAVQYARVLWGSEQDIVTDTGEFFPNQDCSRAHMVTWLYRCFGE